MNKIERTMVERLEDLRDHHGVIGVKAEFESEGARMNELMRLKDISSRCGLEFVLKIGGGEAVSNIHEALLLGVSDIVAPMVETQYAFRKFLEAVNKFIPKDEDVRLAVNVETGVAHQNFKEMLALPGVGRVSRITVGRVDLSESIGLGRKRINSDQIFRITRAICKLSRDAKMSPAVGGAIDKDAVEFIKRLVADGLIDRFETRKVVFDAKKGIRKIHEGLAKAAKFELNWLCNKHDYYFNASLEDKSRIRMIEDRI